MKQITALVDVHDALLALLREKSFARKQVTLASGKTSDFFIDCKQTALLPEGHVLIGKLMLARVLTMAPEAKAVAGVVLGGCPLASAVAFESAMSERPLRALYVRKEAKDHGSQRFVEGDDGLDPGAKIVLLEDVVTTGGSTLRALEKMRARSLNVVGVIALVDRHEGGAQAITDAELLFNACYQRSDFMT